MTIGCSIGFAQADNVFGEYFLELGNANHKIEYRLRLNPNGTFTFHSYTNSSMGIPQMVHQYGKGRWEAASENSFGNDKRVISFTTDRERDFDETNTLDLHGSKARYITKSPRDQTDRAIITRLKFFQSDIFWIEGLEMPKI